MKTYEILRRVNQALGDEMYSINDIGMAFDKAISFVNDETNLDFPYPELARDEYDAIPDKYIIRVIVPYICKEMLDYDEEQSNVWKYDALEGAYMMLRDYRTEEELEDGEMAGCFKTNEGGDWGGYHNFNLCRFTK